MSNEEWKSPSDGDARITKMKDGRTHLAHKAEHAVDMEALVKKVVFDEVQCSPTNSTIQSWLCGNRKNFELT
jgi:transposase